MEPPTKKVKCSSICLLGLQRSKCKECGGSSICQHGRRRNDCKQCASFYIGRTVLGQGTVLDFKTDIRKYIVSYSNGTTATLTKLQLMTILSSVVTEEAPSVLATQGAIPAVEVEGIVVVAKPATGAYEMKTNEATAPSRTVPPLGSICQHGRRRSACKECKGSSICQHGQICRQCKECFNNETTTIRNRSKVQLNE